VFFVSDMWLAERWIYIYICLHTGWTYCAACQIIYWRYFIYIYIICIYICELFPKFPRRVNATRFRKSRECPWSPSLVRKDTGRGWRPGRQRNRAEPSRKKIQIGSRKWRSPVPTRNILPHQTLDSHFGLSSNVRYWYGAWNPLSLAGKIQQVRILII